MKAWWLALPAVALIVGSATAADLPPLLAGMEGAYARVSSYSAVMERQEVVAGRLRPREEVFLKYQRPGRVYLRWLGGPAIGREILYVEGRDDDRLLVHEPGLVSSFFTVLMAPDGERVLRESRHPVTEVGIGHLVGLITSNARRALARSELTVMDRGVVDWRSADVHRYELIGPRRPGLGYYCYRAVVSVDVESGLPIAATIFDWTDRMVEDYAYRDLRLDVELSPRDFDPANPGYAFPRRRVEL